MWIFVPELITDILKKDPVCWKRITLIIGAVDLHYNAILSRRTHFSPKTTSRTKNKMVYLGGCEVYLYTCAPALCLDCGIGGTQVVFSHHVIYTVSSLEWSDYVSPLLRSARYVKFLGIKPTWRAKTKK